MAPDDRPTKLRFLFLLACLGFSLTLFKKRAELARYLLQTEHPPSGMVEYWRENEPLVRKALDLPEVPAGCSELPFLPSETVFRAVFYPSFVPPVALTLRIIGREADLTVTWATPTGQQLYASAEGYVGKVDHQTHRVPAPLVETALRELQATDPMHLETEETAGEDGMVSYGTACEGWGRPNAFTIWSPDERSPRHRAYFSALMELALDVATGSEERRRVETLNHFIASMGISVRDRGGSPRVLQVSNGSRIPSGEAANAFLRSLSADEAILFDAEYLGNLRGEVGIALAHFDRERTRVAWVSRWYAKDLSKAGIQSQHVFATAEAARRYLAKAPANTP